MSTRILSSLALLLPAAAYAEGRSVDIELLRPTYSPGSIPGIDSPTIIGKGAWRTGVMLQFEKDPLILYQYGQEDGSVISNRIGASLGASYDFNKWFSARIGLPVGTNNGSTVSKLDNFAAEGFGWGDLSLGLRAGLPSGGIFHPGLHLDIQTPTSRKLYYMGEEGVRVNAGLLAMLDVGPADLLLDAGFTGRQKVPTGADFELGSELTVNAGALIHVWPERIAIGGGVMTRYGAENLWKGGAENTAEAFTDLQVRLNQRMQVDVGGGRGLLDGYGATEYRVLAGFTYIYAPAPPKPKPPPEVIITKPKEPPPEVLVEEPTVKPWQEGQLARVEGLSIEIRDPILFEFGTPVIRDVSFPTLKSVAEIMQKYGQIQHLVIEGHASEEGSYEYNYNLSTSRAQSIYRKLIEYGVHPERISYRGQGEVAAAQAGSSEETLAADRRVSFDIVQLLDPLSPIPEYPATIMIPWTGETINAPQPGGAQIGADEPNRAPAPTERMDQNFFDTGEDDDAPLPSKPSGGQKEDE